jgi:uncharacterized protein YyaL (SSP411 family)
MAHGQDIHPANRLVHERSPYLLQHAHHPVHWYPWGEEAFAKARAENKLVLVSVGYSSCHWCHVMRHEIAEHPEIARLMNAHFVCIKVDREERPDVDQVYMTAVQLMTRHGGWPLNCFTLPDGRPVYGGTYFPPRQWMAVLDGLATAWRDTPDKVGAQAERLAQGVVAAQLFEVPADPPPFSRATLEQMVATWTHRFDPVHGGDDPAPKFPMPNSLEFLLRYGTITGDARLHDHVRRTLRKMAQGGIFDQIGGGFARYSTDAEWKVPHFEKMLYDNAQLVSLYSRAFQAFGDPLYRSIVERTIAFVQRELTAPDGTFFSALDADTEGEEGRFYLWEKDALVQALGPENAWALTWFRVDADGEWEDGRHVLQRTDHPDELAQRMGIDPEELQQRANDVAADLLRLRNERPRPALDHKVITGWNALMISGLCHAYDAFGRADWLAMARTGMDRLLGHALRPQGGLWRVLVEGTPSVNGYLDDIAFTIQALIDLYGVTFEEELLHHAQRLTAHAIAHHRDETTGLFHYTSAEDPALVARPIEVHDNVVPASNSAMARALFQLGILLDDGTYRTMADTMLAVVQHRFTTHPTAWTNWAQLLMARVHPFPELAITGSDAQRLRAELGRHFLPQGLVMGTTGPSTLPLLRDKSAARSMIFVCHDRSCRPPVATVQEAIDLLP